MPQNRGAPRRDDARSPGDAAFAGGPARSGEPGLSVQCAGPAARPRPSTALSRVTDGHPAADEVPPRPRLLIFGATDLAGALSWTGGFLGYRVTVCDSRPARATVARFPYADEVVAERPHRYLHRTQVDERTVVCVLTCDAEGDIPLLRLALDLPLEYVGAMGSRNVHDGRLRLLREEGVTEDRLTRLCRLTDFDRGTHTPEEMAVSITAEIISHVSRGADRPPPPGITRLRGGPSPSSHPGIRG